MDTTRNESEEAQQLTDKKQPSSLVKQVLLQKELQEMQREAVHYKEYMELIFVGVFLIWTVLFGIWVFDKNAACGAWSLHSFALAAFWTTLALALSYLILAIVTFNNENNPEVVDKAASSLGCFMLSGVLMLVIWGFIVLFTMTKEAGCEGLYYLTYIYPIFLVCFRIGMPIIGALIAAPGISRHTATIERIKKL